MVLLFSFLALPLFEEPPALRLHIQTSRPRRVWIITRGIVPVTPSETLSLDIQKDTAIVILPPAGKGDHIFEVVILSASTHIRRTYRWIEAPSPRVFPGHRALRVHSLWAGPYRIQVYDLTGRKIREVAPWLSPDRPFSITPLSPGVYLYRISRSGISWKGKSVVF